MHLHHFRKKKLWEIKRKFMQLHNLFLLIKFDAQLYFPYFIINIVQKKVCLFFFAQYKL